MLSECKQSVSVSFEFIIYYQYLQQISNQHFIVRYFLIDAYVLSGKVYKSRSGVYNNLEKEVILAIKILIKRQFKAHTVEKASALLNKIRLDAMNLPGYISGETWVNHYDPCKITVVSTWQTVEDWIRWEESDERAANEEKLEGLLEARTQFEVYDLGKSPAK